MSVEGRRWVTRVGIDLVNWQQEEPAGLGRRRQLSGGGTSRMSREAQVRICERPGVKFPGPTRRRVYHLFSRPSCEPAWSATLSLFFEKMRLSRYRPQRYNGPHESPYSARCLKTAADLGTHLRNLLKQNEQLPVNEILARLIEMQDLITDGRWSIIDFQEELMTKNDEIRQLKSEIDALNDRKRIDSEMEHDGYVFWRIIDGKRTGPFCPPCWRRDNTLLPLKHVPGTYGGSHPSRRSIALFTKSSWFPLAQQARVNSAALRPLAEGGLTEISEERGR